MKKKFNLREIIDKRRTTSFWILLLEPIAVLFSWVFVNYIRLKPNIITIIGSVIAFFSAFLIYENNFILAAIFFEIYYIFDMVDGRIARLRGLSSKFGKCLDHILDRIIYFSLSLVIILNYIGRPLFKMILISGALFIFLELFNLHTVSIIRKTYNLNKTKKNTNMWENKINYKILFPTGVEAIHVLFFLGLITQKIILCFLIADTILILNLFTSLFILKKKLLLKLRNYE